MDFQADADEATVGAAMQAVAAQLQTQSPESLVNLPIMSDPEKVAAMQLLATLFTSVFQGNAPLLALLCATMVRLSLQFGNTPASTIGYAGYGMIVRSMGNTQVGYGFGQAALALIEQLDAQVFKSLTLLWYGCFLQHHREPMRVSSATLKAGYLAGMEVGDFLSAGYNMVNHIFQNLYAGISLDELEIDITNYSALLTEVKQDSALVYLRMTQQLVQNLREPVDQPHILSGTAYDETVMLPKHFE